MELLILIVAIIISSLFSSTGNSGSNDKGGRLSSIERYKTFESICKR